jgi:hypothetical protein
LIQYPINPSTETFDATEAGHGCFATFQGDILTYQHVKIFNYDTGEVVWNSLYGKPDMSPIAYNGQTFNTLFRTDRPCENGKRYVWQVSMTQKTIDGSNFIYDMPVLGGRLSRDSSGTTLYIADKLTSIYPWGKLGNVYSRTMAVGDVPTNSMMIKVKGEEREIISYETGVEIDGETYGVITVDSAFTGTFTTTDNYFIYSSFLISPQYFFQCDSTPSVSLSHRCYGNRITCNGLYSQAENVQMKYHRLKLYWANNPYFLDRTDVSATESDSDYKRSLVSDSGNIYAQNIRYEFWHPYRHDISITPLYGENSTDYYKVVCEVVTQSGMSYQTEESFELTPVTPEEVTTSDTGQLSLKLYNFNVFWDSDFGAVLYKVRGYGSNTQIGHGDYMIFRTNVESDETVAMPFYFLTREGDYFNTLVGRDITAPCHGKYRYSAALFTQDGKFIRMELMQGSPYSREGYVPNADIEISEYAYYIIDLNYVPDSDLIYHPTDRDDEKLTFKPQNIWKFVGEIQDTTVTNNLDRVTHVGYNRYIASTSTEVNYQSGTLSAMLGYVDCTTKKYFDTIALVRAWRKFITQQKAFLLKSQKGDVWVVNITDNPSTQYNEMIRELPTTFTFSWAEVYSIDDIEIYGEPVPPLS